MIKKILKDKRLLSLYIVVISCLVIGVTYALSNASLAISFNTALIRIDEEAYGNTTFNTTNIDFKPGDTVEVFGPNIKTLEFTIPDIYDEEGNSLEVARHPRQIIKFKLDKKVYKDDIMRIKN